MGKKYTKYDNIYDDNERIYNDGEIYTVDKEHNKSDNPKYKNFTITIVQPNDAVIEVVTKGKETVVHTTTFSAPYDTRYTVRFKDNKNPSGLYLNCTNNGKLARDITIKAFTPEDKDKQVLMTMITRPLLLMVLLRMRKVNGYILEKIIQNHSLLILEANGDLLLFPIKM